MKKVILLFVFLFVALPSYSEGQQPSSPSKNELTIKIATDLVVFDAQVLNKKTQQVIDGLIKESFILYEDDVKQQVSHFSLDKLPLSVIILLDVSGSVAPYGEQIKEGGLQALRGLKPDDEVALMAFDSEAALIQDFTKDRKLIADKMANGDEMMAVLKSNIKNPQGDGTFIGDSVFQAAEHLQKAANPDGRRVIITVTDNDVFGEHNIYSQKQVINQLHESGVVVYGLVIKNVYGYNSGKIDKTVDKLFEFGTRKYERAGGKIEAHAGSTGGVVLSIEINHSAETPSAERVDTKLAELIHLLRHRYGFGYTPTNPQMDGKFRKIRLKVTPEIEKREGGVTILTRQGYYARPRNSDTNPAKESAAPKKN